jgi:hypothetical protein
MIDGYSVIGTEVDWSARSSWICNEFQQEGYFSIALSNEDLTKEHESCEWPPTK